MSRDYYGGVTQEKPDGGKCLEHFNRFGTDYGKNVSAAVKPGDYTVPSKDANTLGKYKKYFFLYALLFIYSEL